MSAEVVSLFGDRSLTPEMRASLVQRAADKTIRVNELWAAVEQEERELEQIHRALGELPEERGLHG